MGGFVHYRNLPDARSADNLLVEAPPPFRAGCVGAYLIVRLNGDCEHRSRSAHRRFQLS